VIEKILAELNPQQVLIPFSFLFLENLTILGTDIKMRDIGHEKKAKKKRKKSYPMTYFLMLQPPLKRDSNNNKGS
jgi:hypothetical protein